MTLVFPEKKIRGESLCRTGHISLKAFADFAANGRVVVFDTETTGISRFAQIVEIAAVEYVCGRLTRTFRRYLLPTCSINPKAEAVHHISMAFLEQHGRPPREALDEFFAFLGHDVLLVAHSLKFDMWMLKNECQAFGYATEFNNVRFCDTLALARKILPGLAHYRLSSLIKELHIEGENSHEAESDALACGSLFFNLINRISVR